MPYQVRPFRLSDYVQGMSEATAIRTRGNEQLHRGILGGLLNVGEGIGTRRTEKESRRRFDSQERRAERDDSRQDRLADLADARFLLEYEKHQETLRENQANDEQGVDLLAKAREMAGIEAATTGEVSPQTQETVQRQESALGNVAEKVGRRVMGSSAPMPFDAWAATYCPG